jgi:hypothetical protein
MEGAAIEALRQVPSLVVLCWLVTVFVRALGRQSDVLDGIARRSEAAQEKVADKLDKMAEAVARRV